MTDLVDPQEIEAIVGVPRQSHEHVGRMVTAEKTFYILHSKVCLRHGDLQGCDYSLALDHPGIRADDWAGREDQPHVLRFLGRSGRERLVPKEVYMDLGRL